MKEQAEEEELEREMELQRGFWPRCGGLLLLQQLRLFLEQEWREG